MTLQAHAPAPPRGVYSPIVTFFNADDTLNLDATTQHAMRMAKSGCAGIVIQGSNGEAMHLSPEERVSIIKTVRAALDDAGYTNIVIVAGTGSQSKNETIRLAKEAHAAGARYSLTLPPSYWAAAMTQPQIIKYFQAVADESPLPILLYNFPNVANGINMDSDTMLTLAQHPNIVGAKLTCGSMGTLNRVCAVVNPDEFSCMVGKAEFALQGYIGGSPSMIAALANLSPKTLVEQHKAYAAGDIAKAQELQRLLAVSDLAQMRLAVPGLKLAVATYFGYGDGRCRLPLPDGDEAKFAAQDKVLRALVEHEKSLPDVPPVRS